MNRDNQQATVKQLAWLAGIWDGEGTFSLVKQNKKNGEFFLSPKITMENTDVSIVDESCRVLKKHGIGFYIYYREHRSSHHKNAYVITICAADDIIKFCRCLQPYIVAKKDRMNLLLKFVCLRKKRNAEQVKLRKNRPNNSAEELKIRDDLHNLNIFGKTQASTTLRGTLAKQLSMQKRWTAKRDEKIKSDLYGDIQKQAEMTCSPS